MNKETILEVQGLSKSIKGIPVLSDFGMEVLEGDICGIVGPNDSGKTMLLRILTTLVNPDKGKIQIFGKKLFHNRAEILKKMGLMIDEPVFYDHLNAFDNLAVFSRYSGYSKENDEINRVLKLTDLLDLSETKIRYFASGDRKKLGIAMAILNNPPLVVLDEPFRALDIKSLIMIKKLIKNLNRDRGTTFIIASKRLDEMEGFINRMVLMDGGRLIAEGNVNELMGRAKVGLVLETGDNTRAIALLKRSSLALDNVVPEDGIIRISCTKEAIPGISKLLVEENIEVFMLRPDNAISSYYQTFTE